jgi:hypothetical protein
MCALGLFAVVDMEGINKVSIPVLEMVKSGVGSSFMAPLISTLIILGAVSTGVNMIASMTKRIQGAIEAPEVVERSIQTGKPRKVAIIATLVCCIVDFCVAQFGLISLVSKGYSFIAYLTIPVITIPYIIHMIATNFDRKNPPRVTPKHNKTSGLSKRWPKQQTFILTTGNLLSMTFSERSTASDAVDAPKKNPESVSFRGFFVVVCDRMKLK